MEDKDKVEVAIKWNLRVRLLSLSLFLYFVLKKLIFTITVVDIHNNTVVEKE